ncbi:MAG: glycosyltransferase family 4 protein [Alphaproteobacteria bacterium]
MGSEYFPRVLQVIPSFQASGGVERGTLDISQALLERTKEAFVLSSGGDLVNVFEAKGGVHIELPVQKKNPLKMIQNIGKIQRVLYDFKVKIVHARSRAPAWSTYVAARALDIPFITTYHAPYSASSALKRYYNSVMARGDAVIAISSFVKEHIYKEYQHLDWFDGSKIQVIHRGVDTAFFNLDKVTQEKEAALWSSLNLSEHTKLILLPGRLTRWKGQSLLLEAFAGLHQRFPEAVLVFAGNPQGRDAYVKELKQQAAQLGLSEKLRLLPHIDDLPTLYKLAYAVVSASTQPEGFGRVIAEAGAMERPVIAADHGASKEIVIPEETGFLFQSGQVGSLLSALEQILTLNKSAYKAMGKQAKKRILTHFSQDHFCNETLRLYEKISEQKRSV